MCLHDHWVLVMSTKCQVSSGALLTCEGFLDVQFRWPGLASDCPRAGEETAVNGVNDRGSVDHAPTEVASVQSLDSVLATLDLVEFQVDVTLRVRVDGDVDHMAVLVLGFLSDVIFKLFNPVLAFLPVQMLAFVFAQAVEALTYSSGSNMLCKITQRLAMLTLLSGKGLVSVRGFMT